MTEIRLASRGYSMIAGGAGDWSQDSLEPLDDFGAIHLLREDGSGCKFRSRRG